MVRHLMGGHIAAPTCRAEHRDKWPFGERKALPPGEWRMRQCSHCGTSFWIRVVNRTMTATHKDQPVDICDSCWEAENG